MSAYVSTLDLFSIGIGPSSSHTVGPMRAAAHFANDLHAALRTGSSSGSDNRGSGDNGPVRTVERIAVVLCGSLGATGIGHGTPDAVVAGLRGLVVETCDPDEIPEAWEKLGDGRPVVLGGAESDADNATEAALDGDPLVVTMAQADIRLAPLTRLPGHPNGMRFTATDATGKVVLECIYYSIGGGFVLTEAELAEAEAAEERQRAAESASSTTTTTTTATTATVAPGETSLVEPVETEVPYPVVNADQLLAATQRTGMSIADIAWANETALRPEDEVRDALDAIWQAMSDCIDHGLERHGMLPGRLKVRRRARDQREKLEALDAAGVETTIEWLQAYAMAVNEENASGQRVVTAPTNGAAGIIPAVGRHYLRTHPELQGEDEATASERRRAMRKYLLTAGAIGALYKRNASISGAEAGCQGEVGSACSMSAGAICALLGGTPEQVENAAEIAMEHNLGLTCDPVGGLVQVPCIERNAIAACTAVSAARMALQGDGSHVVSLDTVIETMRQTGLDMSTKYKETSEGGLAVNVIEC